MSAHPIIDRLAEISSGELTADDLIYVLGQNRKTIERYLRNGLIESLQAANHRQGNPKRRYKIAAAAVLTFLLRNTGGDKAVLLEAIRQQFPKHHKFCERLAESSKPPTTSATEAPTPSNVIPMSPAKRPRALKANEDHPDQMFLFKFPA